MERTRYQIEFDLRYALNLNERNGRFYRRLRVFFSGCQLFTGMAGVAVLIGQSPVLAGVVGFFLALITVLDNQISPADKAFALADRIRAFNQLRAESVDLEDAEFDRRLTDLQTKAVDSQLTGFLPVAYNDALRELGHEEGLEPLGLWSRFLVAVT